MEAWQWINYSILYRQKVQRCCIYTWMSSNYRLINWYKLRFLKILPQAYINLVCDFIYEYHSGLYHVALRSIFFVSYDENVKYDLSTLRQGYRWPLLYSNHHIRRVLMPASENEDFSCARIERFGLERLRERCVRLYRTKRLVCLHYLI